MRFDDMSMAKRWRLAGAALLVGALALGGCMQVNRVERDLTGEQQQVQKMSLDEPVTGEVRPGQPRIRYLLKVPSEGTLTVTMSWNNPLAFERMIVQTGSRQLETEELRDKLKVVHTTEAIAGFYYIELIPGAEPDKYNLVATLGQ